MPFIRFPAVIKTRIEDILKFINPDFEPTFFDFIDPKTNTPMVDME